MRDGAAAGFLRGCSLLSGRNRASHKSKRKVHGADKHTDTHTAQNTQSNEAQIITQTHTYRQTRCTHTQAECDSYCTKNFTLPRYVSAISAHTDGNTQRYVTARRINKHRGTQNRTGVHVRTPAQSQLPLSYKQFPTYPLSLGQFCGKKINK